MYISILRWIMFYALNNFLRNVLMDLSGSLQNSRLYIQDVIFFYFPQQIKK